MSGDRWQAYNAAVGYGIDPAEYAAAVEEGYRTGGADAATAYLAGVDAAAELERTRYEPTRWEEH